MPEKKDAAWNILNALKNNFRKLALENCHYLLNVMSAICWYFCSLMIVLMLNSCFMFHVLFHRVKEIPPPPPKSEYSPIKNILLHCHTLHSANTTTNMHKLVLHSTNIWENLHSSYKYCITESKNVTCAIITEDIIS